MVITAILMGLILALTDDGNGVPRGPLAPLLIGFVDCRYWCFHGSADRFAMNPARDFGPKLFAGWPDGVDCLHGWSRYPFTSGSGVCPITGAILGAWAYRKLIGRHLPCDVCAIEEKDVAANTQQKTSQ